MIAALRRTLLAFAALLALSVPSFGAQNTLITPGAPLTMAGLATFLNNAYGSVGTNFSGVTPPAVCTGGNPCTYQWWMDTSSGPTLRMYDGASWISFATLDTTNHLVTYTPDRLIFNTTNKNGIISATNTATYLAGVQVNPMMEFHYNVSGTDTLTNADGNGVWHFAIDNDNLITTAPGGPNGRVGMNVQWAMGTAGSSWTGHRTGLQIYMNMVGASGNANPNLYFYTGQGILIQSSVNDGGTLGANSSNIGGFNPIVQLLCPSGNPAVQPCATYWNEVTGQEIDVTMQAGTSTSYKQGLKIVLYQDDAVQGTVADMAIGIASSFTATAGWKTGFAFGTVDGRWSFNSASTLIGTYCQNLDCATYPLAANYGIDFSAVTFTTASLKLPGSFSVDPTGKLTVGGGTGGVAVDVSGGPLRMKAANGISFDDSTDTNNFQIAHTPSGTLRINYNGGSNLWSLTSAGLMSVSGATTLSGALTYGGVTLSNSVTGTGSMVLSAAPTLTGTLTGGSASFTGNVDILDGTSKLRITNSIGTVYLEAGNAAFNAVAPLTLTGYNANRLTLLTLDATTVSVNGVLNATGGVNSTGAVSGFSFFDRGGSGPNWTWYATSSIARLYNGSADVVASTTSGDISLAGHLRVGSMTALSNNTAAGYITANGINIGGDYAMNTGVVSQINGNTGTLPATPSNSYQAQRGSADGSGFNTMLDAFGGANNVTFRRANGTNASKTKVTLGSVFGRINAMGWQGAGAYTSAANAEINFTAEEDWNDATHLGTRIEFYSTPKASATVAKAMTVWNSGGLSVGTGPDPGINNFSAAAASLTALPASAGAGGLYVCVDTSGVLYKKAACP